LVFGINSFAEYLAVHILLITRQAFVRTMAFKKILQVEHRMNAPDALINLRPSGKILRHTIELAGANVANIGILEPGLSAFKSFLGTEPS
jgi:hypothetical protein